MHIAPILAALRHHRLAMLLIMLEIALACAVLCNAAFLIAARRQLLTMDSGVDEPSLALVRMDCNECDGKAMNAKLLAALSAVPGVASVTAVNATPFSERAGDNGITLDAAGQHFAGVPHFYLGGPGSAEALGLKRVAGRAFQPEDFRTGDAWVAKDSQVWITRALAEHLWPGQDPLGREFWSDVYHFRVAGIVDHLARPTPGGRRGVAASEWSVFVPTAPGKVLFGVYLLKATPADLPRVLREARAAAVKAAPEAVLNLEQSQTLTDLRERYFRPDRAMAGMLAGIIVALLMVTALGIVGLASFWVQQRRRQIGIRRAVGATRGDILRYFQAENFLIVSGGIVLGMALTFALNLALMKVYELPRLPLFYLPIGAVVLWSLGQLAVLGPALRAAAVPPVVATRSG